MAENRGLDALQQAVDSSPLVRDMGKAFHDAAQMVGDAIFKDNPLIRALDAGTAAIREMPTKGVSLASNKLAGDISTAPAISPGKSENIQGQGQALKIEKSVGPEMQVAREQAAGAVSNGMKVTEVAAANIGQFAAPATPTVGVGMGQGRGV